MEQGAKGKEQITRGKEKIEGGADKMICLIGSIGSIAFKV
jgi:hypothetical protein